MCLCFSLELHRSLIMTRSSALLDTQLALAAPDVTSPEPLPVGQTAGISPHTHSQHAVLTAVQGHGHSLPPASTAPAPYHQTQIQLGNQNVQPGPVLSVLAYDTSSGTLFDPRSGLATKIKGGLTLAGLGKMSNKFSPY